MKLGQYGGILIIWSLCVPAFALAIKAKPVPCYAGLLTPRHKTGAQTRAALTESVAREKWCTLALMKESVFATLPESDNCF
jgi:hypothetical protein